MRPHVELVDQKDLLWHIAELPHGEGEARQRNLSYDEENGAASLQVEFVSNWKRAAGYHVAQTEWFVLEGSVTIGDITLGEGGYWCAPVGTLTPALSATAGTKILLFREYSDWRFTPVPTGTAPGEGEEELVIKDSASMDWYDVEHPEHGSPMDFERGGTPIMIRRSTVAAIWTGIAK